MKLNNTSSQPGVCGYYLNPTFTENYGFIHYLCFSGWFLGGEVVGDCELSSMSFLLGLVSTVGRTPQEFSFKNLDWRWFLAFPTASNIVWNKWVIEWRVLLKIPDLEHNLFQVQILCGTGFWGAAGVWAPPALVKYPLCPSCYGMSFPTWLHKVPGPATEQELTEVTRNFLSLWHSVWERKGSQGIGLCGNSLLFGSRICIVCLLSPSKIFDSLHCVWPGLQGKVYFASLRQRSFTVAWEAAMILPIL